MKLRDLKADFAIALRGFLMGGADVVPGVSGGTVALITGIYQRLVTAISHVDTHLLSLVKQRRFRKAACHLDLRFLVAMGTGIAAGAVSLGGLMHHLLEGEHRKVTLSVFLGLVVASTILVARMIRNTRDVTTTGLLFMVGVTVAWWVAGLHESAVEPSYGYLFLCGIIGICAMILPGISGAYLLLVFGVYSHMTGILKALPKGEISMENLVTVAVFASGCLVGLIGFSKILKWLLASYESFTLATLCGFMVGALRKLWPFEHPIRETVWTNEVAICLGAGLLALAFVLTLDWMTRGREHIHEQIH